MQGMTPAELAIAADVLDSIDPNLSADVREDAAVRALLAQPTFAYGFLAQLMVDTYAQSLDEPVRRLRQEIASR